MSFPFNIKKGPNRQNIPNSIQNHNRKYQKYHIKCQIVLNISLPTGNEDLISLVKLQQVKIKTLQENVIRKQNKINLLKDCMYKLSKNRLVSPAVANQLKENN